MPYTPPNVSVPPSAWHRPHTRPRLPPPPPAHCAPYWQPASGSASERPQPPRELRQVRPPASPPPAQHRRGWWGASRLHPGAGSGGGSVGAPPGCRLPHGEHRPLGVRFGPFRSRLRPGHRPVRPRRCTRVWRVCVGAVGPAAWSGAAFRECRRCALRRRSERVGRRAFVAVVYHL